MCLVNLRPELKFWLHQEKPSLTPSPTVFRSLAHRVLGSLPFVPSVVLPRCSEDGHVLKEFLLGVNINLVRSSSSWCFIALRNVALEGACAKIIKIVHNIFKYNELFISAIIPLCHASVYFCLNGFYRIIKVSEEGEILLFGELTKWMPLNMTFHHVYEYYVWRWKQYFEWIS